MASTRHFKDTKRAHLLREYASRKRLSTEGDESQPSIEELCEEAGNVFVELGFPHPDQELLKALLTVQICRIIKERGLTQVQAAEILDTQQQQISALMNNRLSSFSVGLLFEFILTLGQDVEIVIRPAREDHGDISLSHPPAQRRHPLLPKPLRSLFDRLRGLK